jgi:hypothetical protein
MNIEPCGIADISVDSGWSYKPSKGAPIGVYNVYPQSAIDELQHQLAERDKDCEALNSVLRDKGWGQGEIDSVTDLWEQNERLLKALRTIKNSGWNDHQTAIWMQKVAAHAINPEQWPVQPEQPPHD